MKRILMIAVIALCAGCQEDAPTKASFDTQHPYKRMELVSVEGDEFDQWEIWLDRNSNTTILCHHSGSTGQYGGRSTSCVVVPTKE